jgi:ureidoglycolate lyase
MSNILHIEPLSRPAFGHYGDVIGGHMATEGLAINHGTTLKFDSEALTLSGGGAQGHAYLYRARQQTLPLTLTELECHRLGSQSFIPLGGVSFVAVVAQSDDQGWPDLQTLRAFWIDGNHAITVRAGTWHHGLIAMADGDFVVIERSADQVDCATYALNPVRQLKPYSL